MAALGRGVAGSAARPPKGTSVACIERCAGLHKAAVEGRITITGRRLGEVTEVEFRGRPGHVPASPSVVRRHRVEVVVPRHARTGRPRLVTSSGRRYPIVQVLRIVPARRLPAPGGFDLLAATVRPHSAFIDGKRRVTLRYRFRARSAANVTVEVVHAGRVLRSWHVRPALPYKRHRVHWDGMRSHRHAAPRGRYKFKVARSGHRGHDSQRFRLREAKFPVRGGHGYGGPVQRFGAPRTGGRVHEGQDIFASCGTPVVAARGGTVQARGSDPALYGNWVVIDGRATRADYRYAHFLHPPSAHDGERVRTGERIGRIGKTGNARTVGCQLHFEVWPRGWRRGRPVDPLPLLRRWDRWS